MSNVAPSGELETYRADQFSADGTTHTVYRKGSGPAVIVITEMPGITPMVLGFADRLVDLGCSVVLPDLYGTAGRDGLEGPVLPTALYSVRSVARGCISRDFSTFALDRTSPIARWLRPLARAEHERCGGPGVGAVGMCFSGGFALAMATDPAVVAPVVSQPSLPFPIGGSRQAAIDVSGADLEAVADRCAAEGLRVLGLRFRDDPFVPEERFAHLHRHLGDGFISVELDQEDGNPVALESPMISSHHSVVTTSLVDEPGTRSHDALGQVLEFFRSRLLP